MNILYISKLPPHKWRGPYHSIPNQIAAQSNFDNVFWYNINNSKEEEWTKKIECNNLDDYKKLNIGHLPEPFNEPDLVIFEGVYEFPFCRLVFEIWEKKIPYLVIPRSALTEKAQQKKRIKKKIGNLLFFNKFLSKATAIQYLTENEYLDSSNKWNKRSLIIPNGVSKKTKKKNFEDDISNTLKGIYIGRIEAYQKGIDILIEACAAMKDELKAHNCTITLYGPDKYNSKEGLKKRINEYNINEVISIHDEVFEEEKEERLLKSDFFIMTSRFEGHPMGLIEALSYGLPCVVTDGTNMSKEIKQFDAGWTAKIDKESVIQALRHMISEKKDLKKKSHSALELSRQYQWQELALISHKKYSELLKGRQAHEFKKISI